MRDFGPYLWRAFCARKTLQDDQAIMKNSTKISLSLSLAAGAIYQATGSVWGAVALGLMYFAVLYTIKDVTND